MRIYHFEVDTDLPPTWENNNFHAPNIKDINTLQEFEDFQNGMIKYLKLTPEFVLEATGEFCNDPIMIIYNRKLTTDNFTVYRKGAFNKAPEDMLEACTMADPMYKCMKPEDG